MADKETSKREYWEYKHRRTKEGEVIEVAKANPDVISTDQGVAWNERRSPLSDLDEAMLAAYYRAIDKGALKVLSAKERKLWKAAFFNWTRLEEIAKKEKLTKNAVTMSLRRAADKLKHEAYKELTKMFNTKNGNREFNKIKMPRQNNDFVTAQGFAKGVREIGSVETDKLMNERLQANKEGITAFLKKHPECR